MAQDQAPGFRITAVNINFLLSIIAVFTTVFGLIAFLIKGDIATKANAEATIELRQEMRDADRKLNEDLKDVIRQNQASYEKLTDVIDGLGDSVTSLALSLREVEVVQRTQSLPPSKSR